ncbi:mitochondrial import receptor subunit TOM6 homolog [Selaginella moellendorffii]|uniref:mitochondrial import receptor subunit TOM6 homolog n=1 Tax=Selaginella moellendorffii TaxID=88036 RepID=UPI000D1C2D58|nr:mitochondrial import receptor subunit TOM6 homolog [Selaginella moellendorffii]|eukprot:XP_024541914.1 mitochondrial import receptor subunit TOM6 homolog [Selaginella moellendorffii]
MFLGQIQLPDKAEAHRQLRSHLTQFGIWVGVIRVLPYVIHFLTKENEELKLEL